jgi:WD40 repeat protein/uncharacterized caspase-like protein
MKAIFLTLLCLGLRAWLVAQPEPILETVLQKGHSKYISAYDFSPDGKQVVTASLDNSIILWSVESGHEIRMFNRHTDPVYSVQYSPDGKTILSASQDNTARVFDVLTGDLVFTIRLNENELQQAMYSRNGAYILLIDERDGLFVYDAATGKKKGAYLKDYGGYNCGELIDPLSARIISHHNYEQFYVCDLLKGDTLLTIPFDKPYLVSFSPNGKYIAASSTKLFTQVFDASNGKLMYTLEDGEEQCDGCNTKHSFSNSGNYLVTMSNKVDAILWDLSTGKKLRSFSELRERPTNLEFSPDDSHVLIGFDEEVFVYDVKSGKEKLHAKAPNISYYDFSFSPDGSLILLPGANNEGVLWDVESGRKKKNLEGYLNKKRDDGLRFSQDNWTDTRILKYISMKRKFALSPDNQTIVIGNVDSTAMVISLETGKVMHYLKGHRKVVFAMDYSPDGKLIATAGGDRVIKLWNAQTGQEITTLSGHRELIFDVAFNSDGTQLISGSWDGTMRIWDMKDTGEYEVIDLGNISPYTVGFTPNDLYAVTGDLDKHIDFWEVDAGRSFRTLVGHTGILAGFDFSPDGKSLVTASWDGKVKMWDVLTGMLIGKSEYHEGQVCAVTYDPTGTYVVSGGSDNSIQFWNPATNKLLFALKGHSSPVTALQFTSDGKKLISCSVDGTVKVWTWDKETGSAHEQYSRIQVSRSEWLATTPAGYFDGSSKGQELVNYVSGLEVIPVASLFDKYFTPGLIEQISKGEKFSDDQGNVHDLIKESPLISFELAGAATRSVNSDSVYESRLAVLPFGVRINSQGQAIDEIRIYNNGKLVIQESLATEMTFRGGEKDVRNFEVPLSDGENTIRAVVVNSDRTESAPATLLVKYDGVAALTDLYILSIGINTYKNPQYNLDYAVNDAKSFAAAITGGADSLFNSIVQYAIHNEQATKAVISATILEIKSKIGPEDVFVFYYAGHGVMSYEQVAEDSDFFIVTHDVTNLYGETDLLRQKAISATELMAFSMQIPAEKQLFILDACHSGGALDAFATRGDGREKALAQLARSTGTFFLTASQDAQYANEVGDLQHGLFTYALLEILNGEMGNNGDDKITISELKLYVEDRVPELSQQYRGSAQYPTSYSFGQDFPIVIVK